MIPRRATQPAVRRLGPPARGASVAALALACLVAGPAGALRIPIPSGPGSETPDAAAPAEPVAEVSALDAPTTPSEVTPIETTATAESVLGGFVMPQTAPQREMDEPPALNIFADPRVAEQILTRRGQPPYQYDAHGRQDPMIIPWVRKDVLSTEHIAQAQIHLKRAASLDDPAAKQQQYELAIAELDQVLEMDPTSRYGREAQNLKAQVRQQLEDLVSIGVSLGSPEKLPQWVVVNTRAIELDDSPQQDHVVVVGEHRLHVNEAVPEHPEVRIAEIKKDQVVYEYKGMKIPIVPKPPKLDPWIITNTKAVVFDNSVDADHIALVGDSLLQVDDTVPRFDEVKIVEINRDSVVYELQGVRIEVPVEVEVKQE